MSFVICNFIKMKPVLKILAVLGFLILIGVVIAYGRGYRWSFKDKTVTSTGILSINSIPNAGKVYVNGSFKGATNINLTLPPGNYQIEIKKDGYSRWTKQVKLQGELVYTINAQLFPLNPSLSPLTNLGIVKAVPVDQTGKIIIFSDNDNPDKDGIYLFEAGGFLSLLPPLKPIILKKNLPLIDPDFKETSVYFSPDYKEAVFEFNSNRSDSKAYLLSLEEENKDLFDVTTSKEALLTAWEEEKNQEILKILEAFPKELVKIASDSFNIISFSPDKTKLLYQTKTNVNLPLIISPPLIAANQTPETRNLSGNNFYVYDKKEDKNYQITNFQFPVTKQALNNQSPVTFEIQWYPDSKHLAFVDGKKISIVDYDNKNKRTLYSGPFEKPFFVITTDGNIVVSANLNPEINPLPDLYLIGIK